MYIENPKTTGSGIFCCIPQRGCCEIGCKDCFFQSGRSYLEPLEDNLPNLPSTQFINNNNFIVRMNDGNDSNNEIDLVIKKANEYNEHFYNTSMPLNLEKFDAPVVLTVNPAKMTDRSFHKVDPIPPNLMFVRFRINTWNIDLCNRVVEYYTKRDVPVILTFMAYFTEELPEEHKDNYIWKKRTLNSYHVLKPEHVKEIKKLYSDNKDVYYCGASMCRDCGNCLREYFKTKTRIKTIN